MGMQKDGQLQIYKFLLMFSYCIQLKQNKMNFINPSALKSYISRSQQTASLQKLFETMKKRFSKSFKYETTESIQNQIDKINKRLSEENSEENQIYQECFVYGEFKIFTWFFVIYCYNYNLTLEELKNEHFLHIQSVFQSKTLIFLRYQTLCLIYEKQKFEKDWRKEEIELLTNIITYKNTSNEWKSVSFELFKQSQGQFFRPFQQCREKWFNYLDPKVNRGEWTEEQDIALLTAADFLGCKWAVISRELGGVRTEHMVKNRYKSLISKWRKKFKKTGQKKIIGFILKKYAKKQNRDQIDTFAFDEFHKPSTCRSRTMTRQAKDKQPVKTQNQEISATSSLKVKQQIKLRENDNYEQKPQQTKLSIKPVQMNQEPMCNQEQQFDLSFDGEEDYDNQWSYGYQQFPENRQEQEDNIYNYALEKRQFYLQDEKLKDLPKTADGQQQQTDKKMTQQKPETVLLPMLIAESEFQTKALFHKEAQVKPWQSRQVQWLMDLNINFSQQQENEWLQSFQVKASYSWLDDCFI